MEKFECQDKEHFSTREDAFRKIHKMQYDSFGGVGDLRPYRCKHCKEWHLTSKTN